MRYQVAEPEMTWQRQRLPARELVVLGLVAVVVICAVVKTARLQAQQAQFVLWANAPGEDGQGAVTAVGLGPPEEQVSRPARIRPHAPPTWQQERDWARADLRELCQQARHVARVLKSASERSPGAREPAPAVVSGARHPGPSRAATARHGEHIAILAGLSRGVQEEARIKADLDRARGLNDVLAARRKMVALGDCVAKATSVAREQHAGRSGAATRGARAKPGTPATTPGDGRARRPTSRWRAPRGGRAAEGSGLPRRAGTVRSPFVRVRGS